MPEQDDRQCKRHQELDLVWMLDLRNRLPLLGCEKLTDNNADSNHTRHI